MTRERKTHIITTAVCAAVVLILVIKPVWIIIGLMVLLALAAGYIFYSMIYDLVNEYVNRDPNDDGKTDEPGP